MLELWNGFAGWSPPPHASNAMMVTSLVSTLLLTRLLGGTPLLSWPIAFLAMQLSARIANYAGTGISLPGTGDFEKAVLFSVVGHLLAVLPLLACFGIRDGERKFWI
jgi:hypothetical protein